MKTGRPTKPTALKVLEGETRPSRLPKNEPKPDPIRPRKPAFAHAGAAKLWDEYVSELESLGTLTKIDQAALAGFCTAYDEAMRLDKRLARIGLTFKTDSGYWQQRPEVGIRNKAWDRVDKFAAQLGIGAAHRTRIEVKKSDGEDNPLADILAEAKQEAEARRRKG